MIRTFINYIVFFIFLVFLTTWHNLLIFKDRGTHLKRILYKDEIKTGDLFLIGYKKPGNILGDLLLKVNFNHIAISVWEDSNLYIVEYANYFNKEQGLLKIPFEKWSRFNKNTTILKNNSNISKNEELEISKKILNFYETNKDKLKIFKGGWNPSWYRFLYKKNKYQTLNFEKQTTCTEIMAHLLCEIGLVKKSKALSDYHQSDFIKLSGFDKNNIKFRDSNLVKIL